jgi:tetratricopeptide (TPR) repeat protein
VALRRLAVFVGGCSLDAAEAVVTRESDSDSGEVLSGLIDKSLVRQVVRNGEPRLLILETIREFAIEQLEASGELEQLQQRHAAYFLARAEEAAPAWWGPEPTYWLDRLEVERDNLRAAIRWSLQDPESDLAVRLVIAFWWFIRIRGPVREGRTWTDQLVAQGIRGSASLWANLLVAAGDFARVEGDLARQEAFNREALAVVDEERHPEIVSWCYLSLSLAAANAGDRDRAVTSGEASLDAARRARLPHLINRALDILSSVHREWGESTRAAELLDEAVTLSESEGMAWDAAHVRSHRADIAADLGDTSRAMELYGDSLRRLFALGDYRGFLGALAGYASLVTVLGDAVHGTRLCGAITSLLPSLGAVLGPNGQQGLDRALTAARAVLDEAAFEAALESGRHLSLQQLRREVEDIASPVGPSVGLAAAPAARVETSPTGPGCGNDNQVQDGPVADLKP